MVPKGDEYYLLIREYILFICNYNKKFGNKIYNFTSVSLIVTEVLETNENISSKYVDSAYLKDINLCNNFPLTSMSTWHVVLNLSCFLNYPVASSLPLSLFLSLCHLLPAKSLYSTQSAGAVELASCIFAEGKNINPPPTQQVF